MQSDSDPKPEDDLAAKPLRGDRAPVRRTSPSTRSNRSGGQTSQITGEETRLKIINAAIETLNTEGIVGASARAIARAGDFNQALIFYHFGSVEGLLIAAAKAEGMARSKRYASRFAEVQSIEALVRVAREVHTQEQAEGSVNVLTQMLAGATNQPALREGLYHAMTPWLELVEQALGRVLGDSSIRSIMPLNDLAYAVASLFIGLELMTTLDPSGDRPTRLFGSIEQFAGLFEMLLKATSPA
jgi:AcrR family transcriptional regulator